MIPKGSLVFTAHKRCPDVSVLFAGLNDGGALTLQRWLDTMEACGKLNGGKYIVIGAYLQPPRVSFDLIALLIPTPDAPLVRRS